MESAPNDSLVICECCDATYRRISVDHRHGADCPGCGGSLYLGLTMPIEYLLALALTACFAMVLALTFPLFDFTLGADTQRANLIQTVTAAWALGHITVAILTLFTVILIPALQLLCWVLVLWPLRSGRRSADFVRAMRLLDALRPWAMVEVFLISVAVAGSKMMEEGEVIIGPGLLGLTVLTLILTTLKLQDLRSVWHAGYAPDIAAPQH